MKSAVYLLCVVFCTMGYHCTKSNAVELSQSLLDAIRYVESRGDVCALGDSGESLGAYQIMHEYYRDAVEANATLTTNGEEYEDLWGKGSVQYSEEVIDAYVHHYATQTRLGHVPTDEDFARIHHGGPDGWNSPTTEEYWRQVSAAMMSGTTVPKGVNTDRCNPSCGVRQCCDRNEDGEYECFCLQAKINNPDEYIKRPCENCSEIAGIDIVFVLDSSGSIGSTNFQKMRNFVNTVVNDLDIGPRRTQVGVIVFSSTASISFHLNTYSDRESLIAAVDRIPYIGGGTKTADALYLLINQGFSGARPKIEGVPQVAMVVTDGQSNDPDLTVIAAEALRQVPSIMTYAIGIGGADVTELNTIASTRNGHKLVRYISSFDLVELERLQEDLREQACTASTVVDVEVTSISRQLEFETKLYLEYFVPDDGFTIQVELDIGRVVVCGSNSLERPDCSYSLTYDWRLEISNYEELFIGPDGFPSNTPVPSSVTTPTEVPTQATLPTTNSPNSTLTGSNVTVFLTIEGLDHDNIFSLNTTYGDTRAPEASDAGGTVPAKVINGLDLLVIIGAAGGGAFVAILICLLGICCICIMCCRTNRSRKESASYRYKALSYAV